MTKNDPLKDIWKKQEDCTIKFSREDIFKMMNQKSSSAVKWILIISILEFILPNLFIIFTDYDTTLAFYEKYNLTRTMEVYLGIHLVVILSFIYLFYKNFRKISAENTVKGLMEDIIKTRKIVKYYIYYNIGMVAWIGIHFFYRIFQSPVFIEKLPEDANMTRIWIIALSLFALVILLLWLGYRLIYGFFLRRLNRNYNELEKTEWD